MSAAHHVNPDQLAMFMPAGQIHNEYEPEANWGGKLAEAEHYGGDHEGDTLHGSIERGGIRQPVNLHEYRGIKNSGPFTEKFMGNGHHRVAAANDIDPKMEVPVMHHEKLGIAYQYGNRGEHKDRSGPVRDLVTHDPVAHAAEAERLKNPYAWDSAVPDNIVGGSSAGIEWYTSSNQKSSLRRFR